MQYERWSPPRIDPLRASLLSLRAVLNRCAGTSEAWRCIKANQFFFSILSFLCCERKTFQRLSLLLSFVFSFGKLSSVPWEWWLLRARYRRVDLGAAKRSVVHYVTPAALHANSISGCRLGTFRVSLFSFFLFIDRIFRLSLYFLLGIASSSFIRERAFLGGVCLISPKWLRNSNGVVDHFWNRNEKIQFGSSSHPLVFFHSAGHAWCPFISLRWLHQPRHGILVCLRLATIIIIVFFFLFSNPLCLSCVR